MKKYILTIFISLLVGFLLSNYIIKEYDSSIISVFNDKKTVYLIQQGVYSSLDSMKENTSNLSEYIYTNVDNLYYVYVGITFDIENTNKIQQIYDFETIVKNNVITDSELIKYIEKYDLILKETNDKNTIKEIVKNVLKKYKGE
mgnify:FL=1|jgi:sulfur transfer complex TusBCD TusB component (DsrH family)